MRAGLRAAFPGAEVSVGDPAGTGLRLEARIVSPIPWQEELSARYARLVACLEAELASGALVTLSVSFSCGAALAHEAQAASRGDAGDRRGDAERDAPRGEAHLSTRPVGVAAKGEELVFPEGLGFGDDV